MHKTLYNTLHYVLTNRVLSDNEFLADQIKHFCPVREVFLKWMVHVPSHYFVGHSSYSNESLNHIVFEELNKPPQPSNLPFSSIQVVYDCPDILKLGEIWNDQRQKIYLKVVEIVQRTLGEGASVRPFGSSVNGFG